MGKGSGGKNNAIEEEWYGTAPYPDKEGRFMYKTL